MTDENTTEADDAEAVDAAPDAEAEVETLPEATDTTETTTEDDETFPRRVVEDLRRESARYREKAKTADAYAERLHLELVRATGRLADPTDLPFDAAHLDDDEALTTAIDALLERKPHLASRRPVGDIGQGHRGGASEPFSLLGLLKERA